MPVDAAAQILEKLESTRNLPTVPAVLMPLLRYMQQPADKIDVHQLVNLIAQDKALAGRCLQVANSPLFGSSHEVENIRSAVVALGLEHIREIAVSCSLLKLMPAVSVGVNPSVFWAHSLGCAMVAREFATSIGFPDPAKAYAAGLLHDVGIVALLWVAPHDFRRTYEQASQHRVPLHEAEEALLGITHCHGGRILASNWHLSPELTEVIAGHHSPSKTGSHSVLTSIVCVSDLLCRRSGLGYGYEEEKRATAVEESAFAILEAKYPSLRPFDLSRFTFETEALVEEVTRLVSAIYSPH